MEQQKVFTVQKEPRRTDRIYMKKSRHVLVTDQQLRECAGFFRVAHYSEIIPDRLPGH